MTVWRKSPGIVLMALLLAGAAWGQTCSTTSDLDNATATAITNAARRYFDMAARGDALAMQQNAIPGLASNFSGIAGAIKDNQSLLAGTQGTPRPPFLLKAEGTAPLARAEFLCGVFGANGQTSDSAVFVIPNLPPGTYAFDAVDATSSKGTYTVSFVMQQLGGDWKLAGYYFRATAAAGHDGKWFAEQARAYKAKGQMHNAWLYLIEARYLSSPVDFMNTLVTDRLYDEMQSLKPADVPLSGPVDMALGAKTYKFTEMFVSDVGSDLDVVVKYQVVSISNTAQTFQENVAVIKALVAKYPELRAAFAGVVARAVDPSGQDYGTLLPMQDIKQ